VPVRTRTVAEFDKEIPFGLTWPPSYRPIPIRADARDTIDEAAAGWLRWSRARNRDGSGDWDYFQIPPKRVIELGTQIEL
jgi:hypothetical protein